MAHKEQRNFFKSVRKKHPSHFKNVKAIDVGSLDINGNSKFLFKRSSVIGIDVAPGKNVDLVGPAHIVLEGIRGVDTILSSGALEHDKYWDKTLTSMYNSLRPGGLMLIMAAGDGWIEHGTHAHHPFCSPATLDHYMNISLPMLAEILPAKRFTEYFLQHDKKIFDLNFYAIKS